MSFTDSVQPKPEHLTQGKHAVNIIIHDPISIYNHIIHLSNIRHRGWNLFPQEACSTELEDTAFANIEFLVNGLSKPSVRGDNEFLAETRLTLADNKYVDERSLSTISQELQNLGYRLVSSRVVTQPDGNITNRILEVNNTEGLEFNIHLGPPTYLDKSTGIGVSIKSSHPELSPGGRVIESKDYVIRYVEGLAALTEITSDLVHQVILPGVEIKPQIVMWESVDYPSFFWEKGSRPNIEQIKSLPQSEVNRAIKRLIYVLHERTPYEGITDQESLTPELDSVLSTIEDYVRDQNHQLSSDDVLKLSEEDKNVYALGLLIKALKASSFNREAKSFYIPIEVTLGNITFPCYGRSNKDKLAFYQQQNRKFIYDTTTSEPVDFLLLLTKPADESLTIYEARQSRNINHAREWIIQNPFMDNSDSVAYVRELNSILLEGIVPDRVLGSLRTGDSTISGRIKLSMGPFIEHDLSTLCTSAKKLINSLRDGGASSQMSNSEKLNLLVTNWAYFDAIHPMNEGNGRTGTMLLNAWLRDVFGEGVTFSAEPSESHELSLAMSDALKHEGDDYFSMGSFAREIHEKIATQIRPLANFVKKHVTNFPDDETSTL